MAIAIVEFISIISWFSPDNSCGVSFAIKPILGISLISKSSKSYLNETISVCFTISKADLENGYALASDEKPLYVVLSFKDEAKYKKLKEFIGIGEAIVGYSMKSNNKEKYIFLGKDYKTLNGIQKVYNKKKCY